MKTSVAGRWPGDKSQTHMNRFPVKTRHFQSALLMSTENVHTPLVPVERSGYSGQNMLTDHVSTVDSEVFSIMKNVSSI